MSGFTQGFVSSLVSGRVVRVSAGIVAGALVVSLVGPVGAQAAVPSGPVSAVVTPVASAPDRYSAVVAATSQGSRVEILSEHTDSQRVWANPDGSFTVDAYAGPEFVEQSNGSWQDVNTQLVTSADGKSVEPVTAAADITLANGAVDPAGPVTATVATVVVPGDSASLTSGAASVATATAAAGAPAAESVSGPAVSVSVGWNGDLPKPTLSDNMATYANVAPGQDLRIAAKPRGLEAFVDLTTKPAVIPAAGLTVTLPLSTKGLTASSDGQGGYLLKDAAGQVVSDAPEAMVWDASVDPLSGDPVHKVSLPTTVTTTSTGYALSVTVPASFLNDPAVQWPVTVDPTETIYASADTYVEKGYNTSNYGTVDDLKVGTYDGGTHVGRSFLAFPMTTSVAHSISGTNVTKAYLHLYEWWSSSCTKTAMNVKALSSGFSESSSTWNVQPTIASTVYGTITDAMGASATSCPDGKLGGNTGFSVTPLVAGWAAGTITNYGMALTASETDSLSWKRFYSSEHSYAGARPYLTVTYTNPPSTPGTPTVTPLVSGVTNSSTPQLAATVTDPDVGTDKTPVWGRFQIYNGSIMACSVDGTHVASGQASVVTPAALRAACTLTPGVSYVLRVYGEDGTQQSKSWSNYTRFTIVNTAPPAPTVTSSTYPANAWASTLIAGSFTFTTTQTDVNCYTYQFDSGPLRTVPASTLGGSATTTITPPAGWHTLNVRAVNIAGIQSGTATGYTFGVAGMTSPGDGDRTLRYVTLNAVAPSTETAVKFQYQLPGTTTWADIPLAQVQQAGVALSAWPTTVVSGSQAAAKPQLVWDAKTALGVDGPVKVQAVFTGATTITTANTPTVTVDSKAYGLMYATANVGVGSVSLQTGNLAVSGSDAAVSSFGGGLGVSRTFNSLDPTLAPATGFAVFGPGWSSGLTSDASDWVKVEDQGTQIKFTDTAGGVWYFARNGLNYSPLTDAALAGYSLVAAGTSPNLTFTLTSIDGGVSTISPVNSAWVGTPSRTTPEPYQVVSTRQANINGVEGFEYNADGTPKALYAPTATGVTCSTTTVNAGCRMLTFTYADADSGTGVANRLSKVTLKTTNSAGAVLSVDVACYTYDPTASFRLAKVWDPRVAGTSGWATTCGTPTQATTYTYNASGQIASITQDGLAPVNIAYDANGRFSTTTRAHNANFGGASLVNTVLYDGISILLTSPTDDSHPDLSAGTVATWGQTTVPVSAAVVFGPGDTVSSSDLKDGTVYALDADGRTVNTAVYSGSGQSGWRVDTTDYADNGNVIRTLTPANRDRALNPTTTQELADLGLTGASSPAIAEALSTRTFYSADGVDVTDTYGPAHQVSLSDGSQTTARAHTHTDYGTVNYPTVKPTTWTADAPLHSAVRVAESATLSLAAVALNEADTTETRYAYALSSTDTIGWDLREPMATTVENGTTDITHQTRFDANGNVIEQRQPSAAGSASNPGTRLTTYYTAVANATAPECGLHAEWFGEVCKTSPGAQPTTSGLPGLVSTTYTYDALLRPTTVTETVAPSGGGTSTRTTTTTYANGGASPQALSTAVTGGVGTAVPATTISYDAVTGLPTTTSNGTKTLTVTYDDFGQPTSYTDGDGAKTTRTLDNRDRLASLTWTNTDGVTALASATYGYVASSSGDHLGEVKTITDSVLGTVTATYDGVGVLTRQTLASGLSQTFTTDPTGDTTSTTWSDGSGNTFLSDTQLSDVHGRWRQEDLAGANPGWTNRSYGYDLAGRLMSVAESQDSGGCETRTYGFDVNSNRTSSVFFPADVSGSCSTLTTPSQSLSLSFDAADRLLASGSGVGVVYDAWGRTTTLPAGLTSTPVAGDALSTYYVNDLVRSLTQGGGTRTWVLDPANRLASMSTTGLGSTGLVNHYSDVSSDSPAWTSDTSSAGVVTTRRYVPGFVGLLAEVATTGGVTSTVVELTGLHGDVLRTTTPTATLAPDGVGVWTDEFGRVLDATGSLTTGPRYGWLGGKQRATDTGVTGLTLMGVRLYSPIIGRFLSTDPVYGGNANTYTYPVDPVNGYDLDGRDGWGWLSTAVAILAVASFIPGVDAVAAPLALLGGGLLAAHDAVGCAGSRSWNGCQDAALDAIGMGVGRMAGRAFKAYGSYRVTQDAEALLGAAPKGVPGRGAFYKRIRKELSKINRYRAAHRAAWRTATVNAINAGFAVAGALQAWRRGTSVY